MYVVHVVHVVHIVAVKKYDWFPCDAACALAIVDLFDQSAGLTDSMSPKKPSVSVGWMNTAPFSTV